MYLSHRREKKRKTPTTCLQYTFFFLLLHKSGRETTCNDQGASGQLRLKGDKCGEEDKWDGVGRKERCTHKKRKIHAHFSFLYEFFKWQEKSQEKGIK